MDNKCDLWKTIIRATKKDKWGMLLYSQWTVADRKRYNRKGSLAVRIECGDDIKDTYIGNEESAVKLAKAILEYYDVEKGNNMNELEKKSLDVILTCQDMELKIGAVDELKKELLNSINNKINNLERPLNQPSRKKYNYFNQIKSLLNK
jgi:hypothetical protein